MAVRGNVVYVLNACDGGSIQVYRSIGSLLGLWAGDGVRTAPPDKEDHSMTNLDDKTARITGGGRGIGRRSPC